MLPRRTFACVVLSVLLQCRGLPRFCGGAAADLGEAAMPPSCRVSSWPSARLRILLPMNASRVAKGSLLVVRDVLCSAEAPCVLTISINGLEWVAMPARKRAVQLRLPASLPPGRHRVTVRTQGQHDSADRSDDAGEQACVWFDLEGEGGSPDMEGGSSSFLNIAHPPDGSWFSPEPVYCPGAIACTFSLRVWWIVQTQTTTMRILINDSLYDDVHTDAMRAGVGEQEEGRGPRTQALDLPIQLHHAGWYTIQVELMVNEITAPVKGQRARDGGRVLSVATIEVEIVAAHEAELRRQDMRMW